MAFEWGEWLAGWWCMFTFLGTLSACIIVVAWVIERIWHRHD